VLFAVGQEDDFRPWHGTSERLAMELPDERARDEDVPRRGLRRACEQAAELSGHAVFNVNGVLVRWRLNVYTNQCVQ
jgi:hypothetical protein